jgi:hypothetical protein
MSQKLLDSIKAVLACWDDDASWSGLKQNTAMRDLQEAFDEYLSERNIP